MAAWAPPEAFDDFRLIRPIRKGGQGRVYLGQDISLHRNVAIKFIADPDPDEGRRQRFRIEARAIAQLSHFNVVTAYKFGEVEGRPYLASEFVSGTPLDLLDRPVSRDLLLRVAAGLARGLAEAHARGILHRDIKPSNAVLTDPPQREVKLIDFGLAKFVDVGARTVSLPMDSSIPDVSRPGAVMGTLDYMAPECLRGDPATPQSDVYSLGAVLYDLYSFNQPSRDRTTRELLALDPELGGVIDRCLREAPGERYASAGDLLADLEPLLPGARPVPKGNPYRGLRPFEEKHRSVFLGRDQEAEEVVERLREGRFVLVAGDSGVGKSSLCRAGVLPRLREGGLGSGDRLDVLSLVPGRHPIRALAEAIVSPRSKNPNDVERESAWLRSKSTALCSAFPETAGVKSTTVLFVDQLEELFTVADREEADAFASALGALVRSEAPARVLGAVRGDFFTRLAALPGLGELVPGALFLLRPMGSDQLRKTVVEPAQAAGATFETSEMVDQLVEEASLGGAGLPLLEFAMAELWDARDVEARRIPANALKRMGGVAGALARHADDVLAHLLPDQRAAARRVLLRLVTSHGTRARVTARELARDPTEQEALQALEHGRLVVVASDVKSGDAQRELAHEALLSRWETLRSWIEADGDRIRIRDRIADAAADWQSLEKRDDRLWDRARLREAARVNPAELQPSQRAFLEASSRRVARTRWYRALLLATGPILALATVGGIRWRTQVALAARAGERFARGAGSLQEAERFDALATRSREQTLGAFAASRSSEEWNAAETAWTSVAEQRASADALYEAAELAFESALAIDPFHAPSRGRVADALYLRAGLARHFGDRPTFSRLAQRLGTLSGGSQASGFFSPARLKVEVEPRGTEVSIASFATTAGRTHLLEPRRLGASPLTVGDLQPGSYLLAFRDALGREFRLPLLAQSGEVISVAFSIPRAVPEGYVFVPPGRFIVGFGDNDAMRRALNAPPAYEATTGPYFIARHEVTFEQYVSFLDSLTERERTRRLPFHKSNRASLELRKSNAGWELMLQPTVHAYRASWGQPIRYPKRMVHALQDWRKFPVAAISLLDAEAYVNWLSSNGLPGAHICNDYEWERAARGADGRSFTTGDKLDGSDANIDETYGRDPWNYGPDEVGSHSESASVFGIQDMAGNAMEMVISVGGLGRASLRGGSWYYDEWSARLPARFVVDETTRSAMVGFRVCVPAVAP